MKISAYIKQVRISPQKMRLVADLVRGKKLAYAISVLNFSHKKSSKILKKVIESAIANAEHNFSADIDNLIIKKIEVDKGVFLKRFTARAKGRGNRIIKPTSHIFVQLGY